MGAGLGTRCQVLSAVQTINVAECRRRDVDELQELSKGYLKVASNCWSRGRVKISGNHVLGQLLEDSLQLHQLLSILGNEERYWVEHGSQYDVNLSFMPQWQPRSNKSDPIYDEHVENQLQVSYLYSKRHAWQIISCTKYR